MQSQLPPDQLDRLMDLEARILKKPKQEVIKMQGNIAQEQSFMDQNFNNNVDSFKKSDDLKCSQNSENSLQQQKIFPSRNLSPSGSFKNRKHESHLPKSKTPIKEIVNQTPPNRKKGQQKNITEYLEHRKKNQKQKKIIEKSIKEQGLIKQYSLNDSPIYKQQQLKSPQQIDGIALLEKDKLFKEKLNQLTIAEIRIKEQDSLNSEMREALNQLQEQQLHFQEIVKQLVIENEQLKKAQLKHQLNQNKMRLGEFVAQRDKTSIGEVWVDGQELKQIKEQLKIVDNSKQELENKKKTLKSKGDEQSEIIRNNIALKMTLIQKEETQLIEQLDRLETEKQLFVKSLKRIYEEEHARFTKTNEWPVIGDRYQILSLLGKGGFSEVYKAYDLIDLKEVACKIHQLNSSWSDQSKQNYIKHAVRENRVHKELNHPHIVRLFDSVEIDKSSFCTVLELCDGPDLSYYLKKYKMFPEKEAKIMITQLLSAVKYLNTHRNKIIHYDLKPQNILFHQNEVKVSDFGLCKVLEDDTTRLELTSQGVGTYWYLPPECFHQGDLPPNISSRVDVWSIGVIFYEMLFGQKPFGQGLSQEKILKEQIILKAQSVIFPNKPQISNDCKDFIRNCLQYNQADRMDVIQAFGHSYINKK